MTTRPGYVWDATASEWVEIGQAAVVSPFKYQTSQPSSPATGDIWIDSDDEVPSVDSTLYYRWTKTMSGGETSLSGTDNNSLALKYTPGYESVFINGVLQVRGSDYVATTGTTVTGLIALTASDVVMVESIIAYSVGDTYTQATLDGKFSPITTTGLVLLNTTAFTAQSTVSIENVFSSEYSAYNIKIALTTAANPTIRLRVAGADSSAASYNFTHFYTDSSGNSGALTNGVAQTSWSTRAGMYDFVLQNPFASLTTTAVGTYVQAITTVNSAGTFGANFNATTSFTGFSVLGTAMTGTIKVYGYK